MNIGKYKFDESNTKKFRGSLPKGMTGIVLKRKFPKVDKEPYYSEYIYSVWLNCVKDKEDSQASIEHSPEVPFAIRKIDWLGNEENIKKDSKISITTTPVFLLQNYNYKETSGFVIFLEVVGIILLIGIIVIAGLYCYKKFYQKKNVPFDKRFFYSLIP